MNEAQVWAIIGVMAAGLGVIITLTLTTVRALVGRLEERIDARFATIDARFGAIDARFEAIDARFAMIDSRFAGIEARLDHLDRDVSALMRHTFGMDRGIDRE